VPKTGSSMQVMIEAYTTGDDETYQVNTLVVKGTK
jgi:hypothetical protein